MAEADLAYLGWQLLGHCLPPVTTARYGHFGPCDRAPEVEPLPGGAGATVSFEAGGRPFRALLPGVSMLEARTRAHTAHRLIRAARKMEMQAEALLRPAPKPET